VRRVRRIAGVGFFIVAAVVLTGCSGIPRSSGVNEGGEIAGPGTAEIEFLPVGPEVGADPTAILSGFIEAASSPQNDFAIARQFLTVGASETWNPSVVTLVDSGVRPSRQLSDTSISLGIDASAVLDAEGRFTQQQTPVRADMTYSFEQRGGQWRISTLPPGIVIDRNTFLQVFRQTSLYFLSPDNRRLVPDVRWFPSRASTTTRIVKALLAGPSAWLSSTGAASTAFPAGTRLVADAVPVQNGVAVVDLDAQSLRASAAATSLMKIQLLASLTQVPNVKDVDLQILGSSQRVQGTSVAMAQMMPIVDGRPVVIRDGKLGKLSGTMVEPLPLLSTRGVDLTGITAGTVSSDLATLALLSPEGVWVTRAGGDPIVVDSRPGLITPALDDYGNVWTVPRDNPTEVLAHAADGSQIAVAVPWSEASSIVALRLSLDGQRAVVMYVRGDRARVVVSSVARDERGNPTALGAPIDLVAPAGYPVDAVWLDAITVAVAGSGDAGSANIIRQVVGGQSLNYAAVGSVASLSGGSAVAHLRELSPAGVLSQPSGTTSWLVNATEVTALLTVQ
jgi:hypothetical protein